MSFRYQYDMMACNAARGRGIMDSMAERPEPGLERPDRPVSPSFLKGKYIVSPHALNPSKSTPTPKSIFNPILNPDFCIRCRRLFQSCESTALTIVRNETGTFHDFHDFRYLEKSARLGCKLCLLIHHALEPVHFMLEGYEAIPARYDFGSYSGDSKTHAVRFYFYNLLERNGKMMPWQMPLITITLEPRKEVELNTAKDRPRFPLVVGSSSTGSPETMVQIREWVRRCDKDHDCRGKGNEKMDPFLPSRLIHVGSGADTDPPRIVDTKNLPLGSKYLTLSHCWGQPGPKIVLKDENLETFKTCLPVTQLPATFSQAIRVTQAIGVGYLWVDSLCIIQEQELKEDWLAEGPTMWKIYRNSYLNLSATASSHSEEGLFKERPAHTVQKCIATVNGHSEFESGEFTVYQDEEWYRFVDHGAVNTRAWVFQERLLATRIVHFSEHQLFWECGEMKASEMFPEGIPERYETGMENLLSKKLPSSDPRDMLEVWDSIVRGYTRTNISFTSDKLIAVSALARQIAHVSELAGDYLAGMWKSHLIGQLLWSSTSHSSRAVEYRAPSWSWASIDGAVSPNFDWSGYNRVKYASQPLIKILNASVIPQGDIYSSVASGSLTVTGPLLKVKEVLTPKMEQDQEQSKESIETPEEKKARFVQIMKHSIPGYTGEAAQSFDVSQGSNPKAIELTFDATHGIAAIDESGTNKMQRLGPKSKRHFEAKMGHHSADLWLDEDLEEESKLKNELYLVPVLCWSNYHYSMNREGREIESLDGLVLTPSTNGLFRRMGIFYLGENSTAEFLCELGNQERRLLPVKEFLTGSLDLNTFLPERWNGKKLEFLPRSLDCCSITII